MTAPSASETPTGPGAGDPGRIFTGGSGDPPGGGPSGSGTGSGGDEPPHETIYVAPPWYRRPWLPVLTVTRFGSVDEAMEIAARTNENGLVHLALHQPDHDIFALCSCCSCCCRACCSTPRRRLRRSPMWRR